jgi:TPR repeat protein
MSNPLFDNMDNLSLKDEEVKAIVTAAKSGDPDAIFLIGMMFYTGENVEQSYTEALKYFLLAAKLGSNDAMFYIAVMHLEGQGVEKDPEEALEWLMLAAQNGNKEAVKILIRARSVSKKYEKLQGKMSRLFKKNPVLSGKQMEKNSLGTAVISYALEPGTLLAKKESMKANILKK